LIYVFFLGNPLCGSRKDRKVRIAGPPGLIDSLEIVTGEEQVKSEEYNADFKKVLIDFIPFLI